MRACGRPPAPRREGVARRARRSSATPPGGEPLSGAHNRAACYDDPQVVPAGRHELLNECTLVPKPGSTAEAPQRFLEGFARAAEDDIPAPAAEARLDDDRSSRRARAGVLVDVPRARMRDSEAPQAQRRLELVVRGEQRPGRIEDVRAPILQLAQRGKARLDSVECRADVEAPQDDVPGSGPCERGGGTESLCFHAPAPKCLQQQGVRQRRPIGEEEEHNP